MKPKKGKLYILQLKWNADPAKAGSAVPLWDRRFDISVFLESSPKKIGQVQYNKDIFILLEDELNSFAQWSPKILTSDGIAGYITPDANLCSLKRVK